MSSSRFNQTGPKIGLSVRLAETQAEIEAAQRLRYQVFAQELGAEIESDDGRDVDPTTNIATTFWLLTTQPETSSAATA